VTADRRDFQAISLAGFYKDMLCLISLALALRLLKDNISTSMIYIIKILQMTEISTFPASILDKAIRISIL